MTTELYKGIQIHVLDSEDPEDHKKWRGLSGRYRVSFTRPSGGRVSWTTRNLERTIADVKKVIDGREQA